jgi:hypothetical protein
MEAVRVLAVGGGELAPALLPLAFAGYSGKVRVRAYDPQTGRLLLERVVEVEEGEPVQLRVAVPRGATTIFVEAVAEDTGETLLQRELPVILVQGAPQLAEWLGEEAQLVRGMEVVGGLEQPPAVGASQLGPAEREVSSLEQQVSSLERQILSRLEQLEKEAKG